MEFWRGGCPFSPPFLCPLPPLALPRGPLSRAHAPAVVSAPHAQSASEGEAERGEREEKNKQQPNTTWLFVTALCAANLLPLSPAHCLADRPQCSSSAHRERERRKTRKKKNAAGQRKFQFGKNGKGAERGRQGRAMHGWPLVLSSAGGTRTLAEPRAAVSGIRRRLRRESGEERGRRAPQGRRAGRTEEREAKMFRKGVKNCFDDGRIRVRRPLGRCAHATASGARVRRPAAEKEAAFDAGAAGVGRRGRRRRGG